jgi:hypothetical protein
MFDALSTCMMVSWFLMPSCTSPLFFGLASSLDFQFFPPKINAIFIKNYCVCNARWCNPVKQCLGSIQLHPLSQVLIPNSLFDIFVNEAEELFNNVKEVAQGFVHDDLNSTKFLPLLSKDGHHPMCLSSAKTKHANNKNWFE